MEQLRNVSYRRPKAPRPWDPLRVGHPDYEVQTKGEISLETGQNTPTNGQGASSASVKSVSRQGGLESGHAVSGKSDLQDLSAWQAKLSNDNLKDRGHPNIVKMLDFFEDREFYYCR
jgi:protein-serine/threonine kinase